MTTLSLYGCNICYNLAFRDMYMWAEKKINFEDLTLRVCKPFKNLRKSEFGIKDFFDLDHKVLKYMYIFAFILINILYLLGYRIY